MKVLGVDSKILFLITATPVSLFNLGSVNTKPKSGFFALFRISSLVFANVAHYVLQKRTRNPKKPSKKP